MRTARNSVFKVEWGLPEIAPKYRKQLAEIVNAYWVDQSHREKYRHQACTVYLNACECGDVRFSREAVLGGSIASIARTTGLDTRAIKKAISNPEQLVFYDFRPYYIVSEGNDVYITDAFEDFSEPYLRVDLPQALRVRSAILALF